MPNARVPAAAGGMPKFDRSQIMRDAWKHYHDIRARYGAWQIRQGIIDASFSACLKMAWRSAKNAAAAVARKLKMERIIAGPKGPTLAALLRALENTNYLSFRYRAGDEQAAIQREIDQLVEAA